jgi:hypothetical protein
MPNVSRAVLVVIVNVGWLVGFAWAVSTGGGDHFGLTLLVVVSIYAAVLLTYACYRRAAQKLRTARAKKSGVAEGRLPFHKG